MGYVIGIDVGSQSAKAVLVDGDGAELANTSVSYGMGYPASGWAEQDPASWEQALGESVRELRTMTGDRPRRRDDARAGLSGRRARRPDEDLRPAIIWLDRRATHQSATLSEAAGEAALVARTGLNPDASHVAPQAMWLRDVEPTIYSATRWLAPVGGHLNGWLTGEVVQDHANASCTLLYDLISRDWCQELVDHAGLDMARLPAIRPSCEVIGQLRPQAADALDLPRSCCVAVGTGDEHAAALGAGALAPGIVVDVAGTAEPVAVPSREAVIDEKRLVETHAHAVPDMLLIENPGFVSGGSTSWWAGTPRHITSGDVRVS